MSDRLTAMDVESQRFRAKLRGYDPDDVHLYLKSVAEEIERLNLENGKLKEQNAHLTERVEDFRTRERTLQETMVSAQRMADELKDKSRHESTILIKEARIKAERLLERAQDQLASVEAEISRAKLERDMFENRVRSAIEEHLALIDLRKSERGKADGGDNVRYLRRRTHSEAG